MTYSVTAYRQGDIIQVLDGITADSALTAIDHAEQVLRLQARQYHISERSGQLRLVEWTGVEFTARRVN